MTPTPLAFLGAPKLAALNPLPRLSVPQQILQTTTIDYTYDPLNRLTVANYSTGDCYHYTYDSVGNRLSQEDMVGGQPSVVNYVYDDANRLASVNGVNYASDANGNLLSDGVNTYVYDSANRLVSVSGQSSVTSYQYNGLGDRLTQNGTQYVLDLNAGLTQVLNDGTYSYLYGPSAGSGGRIAQTNTSTEYFLGDALGSVRQLSMTDGEISLAQSYDPYGSVTYTAGTSSTPYGFTGETTDANGLIYLRARYYNPADARFISRDTWGGDAKSPLSLNRWMYVEGNPVNLIDSTGLKPCQMQGGGRYCILNKGGLIDMNHYRGGRNHARDLINKLSNRERWGKDDEPLDINQDLFGPIPYSLVYRTSIPKDGFPDGYQIINRVALGIFMDFQIRYENFQGLDPRCRNQALEAVLVQVFDGYCSSFAAEDLLSDYLGFIDFIRDDINFDSIVTSLGGGYASSKHPRGYFPKNYSFSTIKYITFDKCLEITRVNRRIPASWRNLLPFESGSYWDVPRGSGRIFLFPWL